MKTRPIKHPILQRLQPFFAIATLFLVLMLVMKVVELSFSTIDDHVGKVIVNTLVYNLVFSSWSIIIVGFLYLLINRFAPKAAQYVASVIFAILLISELGLTLYLFHNGFLLGSELLARPLSETLMAVVGAVGVVMPIVAIVLFLAVMLVLGNWVVRHHWGGWPIGVVTLLFFLLSLFFQMENLLYHQYGNVIITKTHYLLSDSLVYLRQNRYTRSDEFLQNEVSYDADKISRLLASHPEFSPDDPLYPLDRTDATPNFLGEYFPQGDNKPNVVIILVESMGSDLMQTGLMPFIDSLAESGLYFPNCLSTTVRSYGAVPAITGSVGGPKGFQFGTMPQHNSLLSILGNNAYRTNAFYAGYFTFDCIYEYLTAQRVDYLSPFFDEYRAHENKIDGNYWGYHDGKLLQRTLEVISEQPSQPQCNLITTLTMHEPLDLGDKNLQQQYLARAQRIQGKENDGYHAAACYTDDCLRRFFRQYSRIHDFSNTIFVITGDHAYGTGRRDALDFHHVPLIIWSPMLSASHAFTHLVTHNDIAPSLCRLMADNFGITMPPTVHWLGSGLQPDPKTMLIVNYNRGMDELVWHNCYYNGSADRLYTIGEGLRLTPCDDADLRQQCAEQLGLMRYLYQYTYYKDRLTRHPLHPRNHYDHVQTYRHTTAVQCVSPNRKPSEAGYAYFDLMPLTKLKNTEGCSHVRLTLSADVILADTLQPNQYMNLEFSLQGEDTLWSSDKIVKFINTGELKPNTLYHIDMYKEMRLSTRHANYAQLRIVTPIHDEDWVPSTRLTCQNITVRFEYSKE